MAPHVTQWQPDTCGCVIEYEWDDAVPEDQRVHTVKKHDDRGCELHRAINASVKSRYSRVLDENQRKNHVHADVVEHAKQHHPELLTGTGDDVRLVDGAFHFQYDRNGVLSVRLPMHPPGTKTDLGSRLTAKHGAAKVKVL